MAFILSIIKQIQPEFRYDIKRGVFFIGAKFQGDMMRTYSVVPKSKYASLQSTNNESANAFTCMCERQLRKYRMSRWKNRRIADVCFELHFRVTPGQFRSAAASSLHRRLVLLATSTRPSFS